jgi:1,4-alpha-glucan branching enzyme
MHLRFSFSGAIVKRVHALILLVALSFMWSVPATSQIFMGKDSARQSQAAAKKTQEAQKKAAKKQRKAMKQAENAQRKAAKKAQRRT